MPTVAIVGASASPEKFGHISVLAHARAGYTVYPVNPRGGEIAGLAVCRRLAEVPTRPLDRVSLYLPAEPALAALEEIAAHGCGELWLNPGADAPQVVARARELGLPVVVGCSIVALGVSPSEFM